MIEVPTLSRRNIYIDLDKEEHWWENETVRVSVSRAKIEGKCKDEPAEPDSQERWQKLAGRTIDAGDRLQEHLLNQFLVGFITQM